jgi:hypothetical protein
VAGWAGAQLAVQQARAAGGQRCEPVVAGADRRVIAIDGKTLRVRHEVACGEWITAEEVP